MFKKQMVHKFWGLVFITEDCLALQSICGDPSVLVVEVDGDIRQVSKHLVSEISSEGKQDKSLSEE